MAPIHVTRKFWWELIFISVLIFLLISTRSQMKRDVLATAPAASVPVMALGVSSHSPMPLAVN